MVGTILNFWSGGLDSTFVLHWLLTNEEYKKCRIVNHHIHLINNEHYNRCFAEDHAINQLIYNFNELGYRPFETTYSTYSIDNDIFQDNDVVYFIAGNLLNYNPNIKRISLGRCFEDIQNGIPERWWHGEEIIKKYSFRRNDLKDKEIIIRPAENMKKHQIYSMLPYQIRNSVIWCRKPIKDGFNYISCNHCISCNRMKFLKDAISS